MTISQQIIINMVMHNETIKEFERSEICTYSFFESDYRYLEFVLNKYTENGFVNLGDLMSRYPNFPAGDLNEVSYDIDLLIYQLKEGYIYKELNKIIQDGQGRFIDDGIQLLGFIDEGIQTLKNLIPTVTDYDVMKHVDARKAIYEEIKNDPTSFITTGLAEIDKLVGGWSRRGELVSVLARMGMGKTWLIIFFSAAAWKAGFRVGFISVEMSKDDIGFRVDTILSGLSNSALRRGQPVDMSIYNSYVESLKGKEGFLVRNKRDFKGHITPSKIANWISQARLDIVFLDGISYLESERSNAHLKSDAALTTDLAEDLMAVSTDLHCPIIITQQANREGSDTSKNPTLDAARGSDGVNINASLVFSIAYPDEQREIMRVEVLKSRFGRTGDKFDFGWNPDIGYVKSIGAVTENNTEQAAGTFYG